MPIAAAGLTATRHRLPPGQGCAAFLRDLERQNNDRQGTSRIEITEDDLLNLDGLGEPEPVEELNLEL